MLVLLLYAAMDDGRLSVMAVRARRRLSLERRRFFWDAWDDGGSV
jgi:hypothetical protein